MTKIKPDLYNVLNKSNAIRSQKAIEKNLTAIAHALWEWKALEAFDKYRKSKRIYYRGASFFEITTKALFSDMIRNTINVLEIDKRGDATSFWYILTIKETAIKLLEAYSQEKITFLRNLAKKLMHIRDKDFFHHDKNGVLNTGNIWREADIVGKDVGEGIGYLFYMLSELYEKILSKKFEFYPDDYNGEDFIKLLELAEKNHIIEVSPR